MGIPRILVNRRRDTTLVQWYQTLNRWDWPKTKVFGEPEDRKEPGTPRRTEIMDAIIHELGMRKLYEIRKAK